VPSLEGPGTTRHPLHVAIAEQLAGLGGRVLLTGNGGDELTWGNGLIYGHRFWRGDLRAFWEISRYCWRHGHRLWPTWRTLFISPYVPESVKRGIRALRRRGPNRPWPDWFPERTGLRLGLAAPRPAAFPPGLNTPQRVIYGRAVYGLVRPVLDSLSFSMGRLGIEARHPFLDRRLAEFVFAVPVDLWLRDRWPKWLLRHATAGLLPDSVRWRTDKTPFSAYFARGIDRNRAWVEGVLADPGLQRLGLMDTATLLAQFRSIQAGRPRRTATEIDWALVTQRWFQHVREASGAAWRRGES
jgi:asparagine synthase (glutamine-hydrolysing)